MTEPPALRPSATISRPLGVTLGATKAVQEPIDTRCPERRSVLAAEFGPVLTLRALVLDGQTLTALGSPTLHNFLAIGSAHAFQKAV